MKFILAVCVLFSMSVVQAHEHHHESEEKMDSTPAIQGSSLYQFDSKWTNKDGKQIELKSLAGKPRLMAMVYTRCQTACPIIVDDIQSILNKLPNKGKDLEVSIFSFDSEYETPETMQAFIKKRKLGANWNVYKSDKDGVSELAAALGVRYKKLKNGEYIHSNSIYLLNAKGEVAAQKDGLNAANKDFEKTVAQELRK